MPVAAEQIAALFEQLGGESPIAAGQVLFRIDEQAEQILAIHEALEVLAGRSPRLARTASANGTPPELGLCPSRAGCDARPATP